MPSAEVKTSGGVSFELNLDDKEPDPNKCPLSPPKSKSTTSLDEINAKLQEAERRRRSVETQMLEQLAKENARIIEAQAKVAEKNTVFKTVTEKQLTEKMSKVEVKLQANKEALKSKFQEKNNHIKEVQERKKVMGENGDAQSPTEEKQ
ncbi:stathmin-like isoform X1 [Diadema setosum]|uniref:stathmin-like isoform X1 n=1 Tax=Diadema setosum TaxID=31175 RepID=UPI003B3AB3E0